MPRDIGAFNATWFSDANLVPFEFLTMIFGSPVGDLYWTNYPCESLVLDINDGAGTQTWDGTHEFTLGQFEQGQNDALAISDITFGNANNEFSDIIKNFTYGVRGVLIDVSYGGFTPQPEEAVPGMRPEHLFVESIRYFAGVMNRAEVVGDDVRVSILPFSPAMTRKFPRRRFDLANGFPWIPKRNLKVPFGSAGTVALPDQRPNQTGQPGGGGGFVPPPGGYVPTPRGTPRPVGPRGDPPRSVRGRGTRVVTR